MVRKILGTQSAPFEYELVEGDIDHLRTVIATPCNVNPWIYPAKLKLRHRIGRGPFGDVWLATHHRSNEDYEEHHEVAVKMLHHVKDENKIEVLDKLEDVFTKCQQLNGVCWLDGISVIDGKICIIMKFYEGSVGDKMAHVEGGKLLLPDVLRYGIDIAQGIRELHSKDILVLNLKPFNFLLNESDHAIIGDIGIPILLLGVPMPSPAMGRRVGTANYMAPEQWEPDVRGPLSFEADSWGFACSVLEMLTGVQPWSGKSTEEIYESVVLKKEKPVIPRGLLPPAVENIIFDCFEYDFRSRPLMTDILLAFKSSQNAIHNDGICEGLSSVVVTDKYCENGCKKWFLSKDHLRVGDTVRSRKFSNSRKPVNMNVPEGTIVGIDQDSFLLVRVHSIHDPLRVHASTLERVTDGLAAGDWVRLKHKNRNKNHSAVGTLRSITRDGNVSIALIGLQTLWKGKSLEIRMAESYRVGQFIKLKASIVKPRFEWPRKTGGTWATGKVSYILPNGCLVVKFPGRSNLDSGKEHGNILADPAETEVVSFNRCNGVVKKYQHLEDLHWAVRPIIVALGLFTAMKLGIFMGKRIGNTNMKKKKNQNVAKSCGHNDSHGSGNAARLPPPLANINLREGSATGTAVDLVKLLEQPQLALNYCKMANVRFTA